MAHAESITFEEFRTRFSTEDACRAELFRLRFPKTDDFITVFIKFHFYSHRIFRRTSEAIVAFQTFPGVDYFLHKHSFLASTEIQCKNNNFFNEAYYNCLFLTQKRRDIFLVFGFGEIFIQNSRESILNPVSFASDSNENQIGKCTIRSVAHLPSVFLEYVSFSFA